MTCPKIFQLTNVQRSWLLDLAYSMIESCIAPSHLPARERLHQDITVEQLMEWYKTDNPLSLSRADAEEDCARMEVEFSCALACIKELENATGIGLERMWIYQPSTLQPLHPMHGQNVLAAKSCYPRSFRIYPCSGDIISMEAPSLSLSKGWRPGSHEENTHGVPQRLSFGNAAPEYSVSAILRAANEAAHVIASLKVEQTKTDITIRMACEMPYEERFPIMREIWQGLRDLGYDASYNAAWVFVHPRKEQDEEEVHD